MSTRCTIKFSKESQDRIKELGKMGESYEKAIIRLVNEKKPQQTEA